MKGIKALKLEYSIGLQKFFLNLMLLAISPTNRLALMISKKIRQEYCFTAETGTTLYLEPSSENFIVLSNKNVWNFGRTPHKSKLS